MNSEDRLFLVQDTDRPLYVLAPSWQGAVVFWKKAVAVDRNIDVSEVNEPLGVSLIADKDEWIAAEDLPIGEYTSGAIYSVQYWEKKNGPYRWETTDAGSEVHKVLPMYREHVRESPELRWRLRKIEVLIEHHATDKQSTRGFIV